MDFEIAVVCLLVILYIIAIITLYMCLKVKLNSSSCRNINTGDTYLDN